MSKRARWTHWDHFGAWAILAALIWCIAYLVTDVTRHITISAIEIRDVREGEQIHLDVTRTLHGRWPGAYEVTIRRVPGGSMVCTTGRVEGVYSARNADGTERDLPIPTELKWWADGGRCNDDLRDNTLPVGRYSVETCHARRFLWLFYKWHCWPGGPIFEVKPE